MSTLLNFLHRFGLLFKWWVVIQPWDQAVRVRFGNRITLLAPGVRWAIPWVDVIYTQSVRLRVVGLPIQTVTTRDNRTISVAGAFSYQIVNLVKLYQGLHHAEESLRLMGMGAIANFVHSRDLAGCGPRDIESALGATLNVQQFGIESRGISVTNYAVVKTYRLINDQYYGTGDALDTTSPASSSTPFN